MIGDFVDGADQEFVEEFLCKVGFGTTVNGVDYLIKVSEKLSRLRETQEAYITTQSVFAL